VKIANPSVAVDVAEVMLVRLDRLRETGKHAGFIAACTIISVFKSHRRRVGSIVTADIETSALAILMMMHIE